MSARGGATPAVVVLGGGLAGITSALALADAGVSVTLVERRSRLGGLTWSFERKGRWFDNGQHVFLRCCSAYRALLSRLGVTALVTLQDRLELPVLSPGGRRAELRRSRLPAPLHLGPALARYHPVPLTQRARLPWAALALGRLDLDDPALDGKTFLEWLERHHQGPQSVAALWDLITLPTVNLPASEASLALAAKVFRTGLLDSADAGDLGWAKVPLARLHDLPARRALAGAGVQVLLGSPVTSVEPSPGEGHAGISGPPFVVRTPGAALAADAVVVALPPEVAATVVPRAAALPPVERLGASPIVNVHLVLDRRVTDVSLAAVVDSPVQFVFDRTESSGTTAGQCLVVSLSGATRWVGHSPAELISTFAAALGDVFPAARRAEVVDAVVTREQRATFRGTPGSRALRPANATALGGLALAGAWTDTGWPATMEGAVRSGWRATATILSHLGRTATTELPVPWAGAIGRIPEEAAS